MSKEFEQLDFYDKLELTLTKGRYYALRVNGRYIVNLYRINGFFVELWCHRSKFCFEEVLLIPMDVPVLIDHTSPLKIYSLELVEN